MKIFLLFSINFLFAYEYKISPDSLKIFQDIANKSNSFQWNYIIRKFRLPPKRLNLNSDPFSYPQNQIIQLVALELEMSKPILQQVMMATLDSFDILDFLSSKLEFKKYLEKHKRIRSSKENLKRPFFERALNQYVQNCANQKIKKNLCFLEILSKLELAKKNITPASILFSLRNSDFQDENQINQLQQTFWSPQPGWENIGYTLEKCWNSKYYHHELGEVKEEDKEYLRLDPKCMPDVVYQWIDTKTLKSYFRNLTDKTLAKWQSKNQYIIFSSRSPSSSHGYNWNLVRFKLKKNLNFRLYKGTGDFCQELDRKTASNTILVRALDSIVPPMSNPPKLVFFVEFDFCSMDVVHSYSFGLKENYDELVKDSIWILKKSLLKDEDPQKLKFTSYLRDQMTGVPYPFFKPEQTFDEKFFTKEELLDKIIYHYFNILRGGREVLVYHPRTNSNERNKNAHLATKIPIYWNSLMQ